MNYLFSIIVITNIAVLSGCGQKKYSNQAPIKPFKDKYVGSCDVDYTALNEEKFKKYPFEYVNHTGIEQIEISHLNEILSLPESFLQIGIENDNKFIMHFKIRDIEGLENFKNPAVGVAGGGSAYLSAIFAGGSTAIHEYIHLLVRATNDDYRFEDERLLSIYEDIVNNRSNEYPIVEGESFSEFIAYTAEAFYCSQAFREEMKADFPDLYEYLANDFEKEVIRKYQAKKLTEAN